MAYKPEIQYVGQFYVHGSEARQLAQEQKKEQSRLPLAKLENVEKICLDPIALIGMAVAVVMLVVMLVGVGQIQEAWQEYNTMASYLEKVRSDNSQLLYNYRMSYDLAEVETRALALGMVPIAEAQHRTVTLTMPEPEPVTTWWDDVVWFMKGLFA